MRRHEAEGYAMGCPGDVEGCAAEAFLCPCGVLACEVHGHADGGNDPYCPHWLRAEILDETDGRGYEDIDLSRWEEGRVRESREGDGTVPKDIWVKTAATRRSGLECPQLCSTHVDVSCCQI